MFCPIWIGCNSWGQINRLHSDWLAQYYIQLIHISVIFYVNTCNIFLIYRNIFLLYFVQYCYRFSPYICNIMTNIRVHLELFAKNYIWDIRGRLSDWYTIGTRSHHFLQYLYTRILGALRSPNSSWPPIFLQKIRKVSGRIP